MTPIQAVLLGFVIVAIPLHMMFFRRLQLRCPKEWQRLGSPNPFLPNDARTGWRLTKYVMGAGFKHLPETSLVRLGRILCVLEWIWVSAWVLYIALVLFVAIPAWLHWI
jgi:hypothetical protein